VAAAAQELVLQIILQEEESMRPKSVKTRKPRRKETIDPIHFQGLAGKVVKCADSIGEDGKIHFAVRFTDGTELALVIAAQPKISSAKLLRWKHGNSRVVRSYPAHKV